MKSEAEATRRLRRLGLQLETAEDDYTKSIGCGDEWLNLIRCRRLAVRIAELEWVLQPEEAKK